MQRFICAICGYVHDEAEGVRFGDLPSDWVCPICKANKDAFREESAKPAARPAATIAPVEGDMREMTALEMGALCSNLARGCEKQYKGEEAARFRELADYFKAAAAPVEEAEASKLAELVAQDLSAGFPQANAAAAAAGDRGALRALVWSEKVTRMLKSLLDRFAREGEKMLENTGVYICTICGFVFIGDALPEVCPVCKVPNWKFEKVEGR